MGSALDSDIKRSGFGPWPGTMCCVLGQDTLLSRSGELNPGGSPAMD